MSIMFYHEKNLPPYQYIILVTKDDGERLTWESGPQYKNRWRYRPKNVAIVRFAKKIDSSEFPIDKKKEAIAVLFDSFMER